MAKLKLTKRAIDALKPDPERVTFYRDSELKGFHLSVTPDGTKTFRIEYRNRSGRKCSAKIGPYGRWTPERAREEAKKRLRDVDRGIDPAEKRAADRAAMTVAQLCREYLDRAERGLILKRDGRPKKASTLYIDRGRIEQHIIPLLGRRAVKEVTRRDVTALLDAVIEGKTAKDVRTRPRGLARVRGGPTAASRVVGLLGAVFSYALERGYRDDNPVRGIVKPKDKEREVRLEDEQWRALGAALDEAATQAPKWSGKGRKPAPLPWQAVAVVRLIALTDCRKGEIENLRWSEVDLKARMLRLEDSKTGRSVRPLGGPAVELLRELRAASKSGRDEYVFPAVRGEGAYKGLKKAWPKIAKRAGLVGVTLHGLRHAFSSVAADLGYSDAVIGGLLGHGARTVSARYRHVADPALLAAADKVSHHIAACMAGERPSAEVIAFPAS